MKRFFLFSILFVFVIVISIVGLVLFRIKPILNKVKPEIEKQISNVINEPISLGDLDLEFFPNIGLKVDGFKLKNKSSDNLSLKSIVLKTSLLPLVKGEVNVKEFIVEDLKITILKNKDNSLSFGGISLKKKEPLKKEKKIKEKKKKKNLSNKKSKSPLKLDIKNANIKNALVIYIDKTKNDDQKIKIKDLNLNLQNVSLDKKGILDLKASFLSEKKENIKILASFDLKNLDFSKAVIDSDIELKDLSLESIFKIAKGYKIEVSGLEAKNSIFSSSKLNLKNLTLSLKETLEAKDAYIKFKEIFAKPKGDNLKIDVNSIFKLKEDVKGINSINCKEIKLLLGNNKVNSSLFFIPEKEAKIKINSSSLDLKDLSNYVLPLKDFNILGHIKTNLEIITPLKASKLDLRGDLTLDNISVVIKGKEGKKDLPIKDIKGDILFDKDLIKTDNLSLLVKEELIKVSSILKISKNLLTFKSLILKAFMGEINLNGFFNTGSKNLLIKGNGKGFDFKRISEVFMKDSKISLSGKLKDINLNINAFLEKMPDSLKGELNLDISKGEINGLGIIGRTLDEIKNIPGLSEEDSLASLLSDKELRDIINKDKTLFDNLKLNTRFNEGKIKVENVKLFHALYIIKGAGIIDYNGNMSFNVELKLIKELAKKLLLKRPKLGFLADENGEIVFPVTLKRTKSSTIVLPNIKELLKRGAKNAAKESMKKELNKIIPEFGKKNKEASKLINSIF